MDEYRRVKMGFIFLGAVTLRDQKGNDDLLSFWKIHCGTVNSTRNVVIPWNQHPAALYMSRLSLDKWSNYSIIYEGPSNLANDSDPRKFFEAPSPHKSHFGGAKSISIGVKNEWYVTIMVISWGLLQVPCTLWEQATCTCFAWATRSFRGQPFNLSPSSIWPLDLMMN